MADVTTDLGRTIEADRLLAKLERAAKILGYDDLDLFADEIISPPAIEALVYINDLTSAVLGEFLIFAHPDGVYDLCDKEGRKIERYTKFYDLLMSANEMLQEEKS